MAKYNVSKKESKRLGIKRVKAGGGASMASDYGSLEKSLGGMESQVSKYADFASDVAKLPYELKDEFRKRRSPKLDAQIRESEQRMLGGYSEGLNKYKDIQDPFQRRELSEKYQGSLAETYGNLLDERDRRGGKFAEYIDKWSGLFGAEAARQQTMLDFTERKWQNYLTLADKKESKRRWEIELAEKRKTGGRGTTAERLGGTLASIQERLYGARGEDKKTDPSAYIEEMNKYLRAGGDVSSFHEQFGNLLSEQEQKNLGLPMEKEKGKSTADLKYKDEQSYKQKFDQLVDDIINQGVPREDAVEYVKKMLNR